MLQEMLSALTGAGAYRGQMFINGHWTDGSSRDVYEVENPATGRIIGTIPQGGADDAAAAVDAAQSAQPAWAALPPFERAKLLVALADAVKEHAGVLARIVVAEQGKPLNQAMGEVGATETFLRYAAESARRIEGDIVPSDSVNEEVWIRRVPHGVVVGLTAWNFPAALAARKLGPALVAGNTFVLKAHEFTPFSGIALVQLADHIGFPPGVFNVVTGAGRTVGEALVTSPASDLITMTGSTRAGREIYRSSADRIKVLRLELGGKAPFIVMDDADIDAAVESAVVARFSNCGQICTCNERMYLHDAIAGEFLDKFLARTSSLRVGDPLSNPDIGPKISGPEVDKIEAIVEDTLAAGAEVLLRGGRLRDGAYAKGHWYSPTVLKVRDNTAPAMQKEIFGPVVPAMTVSSFEEALALANDSEYGLSAYVYSQNFRRLMQAARDLQFGEIYVNRTSGELVQGFHNGWGQSGLGGEDGKYGLDGYFRKKTMYVNWS
ncbi:aldehyde dehydrogenase family protein [Devosia salina]|uniref:Aldehyde dehydrogenase family protein n=1 Tax=Devosia salina TaxID=2860336 RepID=A0ABX8W877_9HYPH|nr:aldehyde dehydrogenase family protein [Devosia salina]QYO75160.1 aldehyde dehydrogenase family protein [Devosia salina]